MTSLGCGVNEMCVASDDHTNKGVCKCDNLHHLDRLTGLCSSSSTGRETFNLNIQSNLYIKATQGNLKMWTL